MSTVCPWTERLAGPAGGCVRPPPGAQAARRAGGGAESARWWRSPRISICMAARERKAVAIQASSAGLAVFIIGGSSTTGPGRGLEVMLGGGPASSNGETATNSRDPQVVRNAPGRGDRRSTVRRWCEGARRPGQTQLLDNSSSKSRAGPYHREGAAGPRWLTGFRGVRVSAGRERARRSSLSSIRTRHTQLGSPFLAAVTLLPQLRQIPGVLYT
jgi:hypothetical protein